MKARLQLFGPPAVLHGEASLALPFERRGQLVALLALRRAWVPRAEVAALLWPEQREALASTNLRKTLHRLQGTPWDGLVEVQASALRCEAGCDVHGFEAALAEGRAADALALRRGELLAGFDDDANEAWSTWLRFERDRLRAAWRDAALARLDGEIDPGDGLELATRLLEADPLDEAALRAQMRLLAASGRTAQAHQVFRDFAARLTDELGLAPGPELQALHDTLGSAAVARAAPAPIADEGFVGRTIERRRIAALLTRDGVRLVTLVGPGGVGKTRLAQRMRAELDPDFPGGAVFVPLDDVTAVADLAPRIAREAGVALRGRDAPLAQLASALRERQTLLVLDNFEQLTAEAAQLDALLDACPRLALLVTSRVRLSLAREQSLPLDGLPCPEPEDSDSVEAFDAARVFIAAAQRIEPGFAAAAEGAAIVDICRQVGGLPLALELAAAWTRVLSCESIAAELRAGTELLRATDAAHPARHASIELVFEQSWQRLVAAEREALARLSVFRGGFTAEAARAVAGVVLPVLGALADKSLLRKDGSRLTLHPLVQQLAAARLGSEHEAAVRAAHAAYFEQRLAHWHAASEAGERAALQGIEVDFENHRRAWQWAVAQGDADALLRSVPTLLNHWEHRARFEDGLAWLREALDSALARAHPLLRTRLLAHAAMLEFRLARYAEAEADATQALAAARARRHRPARYEAIKTLAGCALFTGRFELARERFQEALDMARVDGLAAEVAGTLDNLSLVEKRLGRYEEALRLAHEGLAQHRASGNFARAATSLSNLASLAMFMDDNEPAAAYLHEALALAEQHGLVSTRAYSLSNLSELARKSNDLAAAQQHAERALDVAEAQGMRILAGWLEAHLARLAALRGDLAPARSHLARAAATALELSLPSVQATALQALAELLEAQGEPLLARRVLAFAADETTLAAPDRDELRVEWARRATPGEVDAGWPGALTLPVLLQRIVAEATQAHAPLIALLRDHA